MKLRAVVITLTFIEPLNLLLVNSISIELT